MAICQSSNGSHGQEEATRSFDSREGGESMHFPCVERRIVTMSPLNLERVGWLISDVVEAISVQGGRRWPTAWSKGDSQGLPGYWCVQDSKYSGTKAFMSLCITEKLRPLTPQELAVKTSLERDVKQKVPCNLKWRMDA